MISGLARANQQRADLLAAGVTRTGVALTPVITFAIPKQRVARVRPNVRADCKCGCLATYRIPTTLFGSGLYGVGYQGGQFTIRDVPP